MERKLNKEQFLRKCKGLMYNMMPLYYIVAPYAGLCVKKDQSPVVSRIVTLIVLLNLIPNSIETYFSLGDINKLAPCLSLFGILVTVLIVIENMQRKKKTFLKLLEEMRTEFEEAFSIATEYSRENLKLATINNVLILILAIVGVSLFVTDALISDENKLVYPAWYPFDISEPTTYWILFSLQLSSGFVIGLTVFSVVTYFIQMAEQMCMQFDNLANQLKFRLETLGEKQGGPISEQSFDVFLCECVSRHNVLLKRVHHLDELFSNFQLAHFVFFVLVMSLSALEFMSATTQVTPIYVSKNIALFAVGCSELYLTSVQGSRLLNVQESILDAVSSENVILCPEGAKRTLSIIAIRAKLPVMLTIGGFKLFDVVGFSETLGAVYTIFTLLIHFKHGETV